MVTLWTSIQEGPISNLDPKTDHPVTIFVVPARFYNSLVTNRHIIRCGIVLTTDVENPLEIDKEIVTYTLLRTGVCSDLNSAAPVRLGSPQKHINPLSRLIPVHLQRICGWRYSSTILNFGTR